jgi:hypothetical protein
MKTIDIVLTIQNVTHVDDATIAAHILEEDYDRFFSEAIFLEEEDTVHHPVFFG